MPKRTLDHHTWLISELKDPVTASNYLNEAYSDSPKMFLVALRNVGEAWRMSLVATKAGVGRESLYKTLSKRGNPRLYTLDAVLRAVGIKIEFQPEKASSVRSAPQRQPPRAYAEGLSLKKKGRAES
jgi:probable addiction module antidote protein